VVMGGKYADEFVGLIVVIVLDVGLSDVTIHVVKKKARTLFGYFRVLKEWDVVILSGCDLVGAVEVKS